MEAISHGDFDDVKTVEYSSADKVYYFSFVPWGLHPVRSTILDSLASYYES